MLLVGTRTNQNGTDSWRIFSPATQFIHIDVDPTEIGRNYEALRLVGDAAATLDALTEVLSATNLEARRRGRPALECRIASAWESFDADRRALLLSNAEGNIRPERVMAELQCCLRRRQPW